MIKIILSSFKFNICFGCSKEMSHGDSSFEYPQHMFWLRNKKKIFFKQISLLLMYNVQKRFTSRLIKRVICLLKRHNSIHVYEKVF